jgi:hypothetical protein
MGHVLKQVYYGLGIGPYKHRGSSHWRILSQIVEESELACLILPFYKV